MTAIELQSAVDQFRWYHEIDVGQGIKTKPRDRYDVSWDLIEQGLKSVNVTGQRVLDIGTRDGKFAFEAFKNGASVFAIDNDLSKGALWLKEHFNSNVEFGLLSIYDLAPDNYDIVFLFGVLYHLRYPMWGLRKVSQVMKQGGKLYIETAVFVGGNCQGLPLLHCPVRQSPYEQTSCSFFNLRGLEETLWSFGCTLQSHKFHKSEDKIDHEIMHVRRIWIEAEKTHEMPEELKKYWEGMHTSHD